MSAKKYLLTAVCTLLLFLLGTISINLLVDPLNVYRLVDIEGFNQFKPKLGSYSRLAKPLQLERDHYQRAAFGSSRTEIGIPVYGTAWDHAGDKGINAAVSGADIVAVDALFRHALLKTDLQDAVIGVDFFMFNGEGQASYSYPQVLAQSKHDSELARKLKGYQLTLFSPGITEASIYTLRKQKPSYDKYLDTGQINNEREINKALEDGYERVFTKFEDGFMRSTWTPCSNNLYSYETGTGSTLTIFKNLLQEANRNNVSLSLYIAPLHVRLLVAMEAMGLWPAYEQWKRDLVAIVDEVKTEHPSAQINLWDFSGYNQYSNEALPKESDRAMAWYIDSSHFSEALGQKMLDTMYGGGKGQISGFGSRLSVDNVDDHLSNVRSQFFNYIQRNPDVHRFYKDRASYFLNVRKKNGKVCDGEPSVPDVDVYSFNRLHALILTQ